MNECEQDCVAGTRRRGSPAFPRLGDVPWLGVCFFCMYLVAFGTANATIVKPWEMNAGVMDGFRSVRADGRDATFRHPYRTAPEELRGATLLDESAPLGLRASGASSTPTRSARPVLVVVWTCATTQLKKNRKRVPFPALPTIDNGGQFSSGMWGGLLHSLPLQCRFRQLCEDHRHERIRPGTVRIQRFRRDANH